MNQTLQLEETARQLEPDFGQRKLILEKASSYIQRFLEELPRKPGYRQGDLYRLKSIQIEEEGKPIEELLNILETEVDTVGINSASGRHLGYIPGGGLWTSAIADMLAAATNRFAGIGYSSPGAVEMENQLIRWLASIVGYPASAHGNLTSGGSVASLIAIKAAREAHRINSGNVRQSVIYLTEQVHHCFKKAFNTTGLHEAILRLIPMNEVYQMDTHALREQIRIDKRAGLNPFLVIGTAGTTDTGAIDPLAAIATIAEDDGLWFHVDAAYGGFFMLVEELKGKFRGIERSDSVVMDPHKALFIPYGSGVVLVKELNKLLASNSSKANYMQDAYGQDQIDPADTGPELSRHFRGLRMWLPLHLHGLAPFKANLKEKWILCRYFYNQIRKLGLEAGTYPELTVTIFRLSDDQNNNLNELFLKDLLKDGRVFFSSTMLRKKLWIRCAVVSFRTHRQEVDLALELICEKMAKYTEVDPQPGSS